MTNEPATQTEPAKEEKNHARGNAKAWLESICEMVNDYEWATDSDPFKYDHLGELVTAKERERLRGLTEDETLQAILGSPLGLSYRSGWCSHGEKMEPADYQILLTWGGPALRIIGAIGEHGEVETATLEYQDWGTLWTEYPLYDYGESTCEQLVRFAGLIANAW